MPGDPTNAKDVTPEESGTHPDGTPSAPLKKRRIIALAAAALIAIAGAAGAYVLLSGHDEPGVVVIDIGGAMVYHEFPEILTHLSGGEKSSNHTKLEIVIELPESHVEVLQDNEAVIADAIQSYLRGKTREDLAGEAGAERLRTELLVMINQRIAPAEAYDILFKTFLID